MEDLRSGIEHLKQAKAHMSEANGIMSDCISKINRLEEENVALKAKLELTCMELPLDADGVPIRIGDKIDVDGDAMNVIGYRLYDGTMFLIVKESGSNSTYSPKPSRVRHFKPVQPDSWEKLEEDMMKRSSCHYFGIGDSIESCNYCPHGERLSGTTCFKNARLDMIARAKKLAGIEEEAQR